VKIDPDKITQLERTRRGDCARCGESWEAHTPHGVDRFGDVMRTDEQKRNYGKCPDRGGSFTWAQTRTEIKATIERLEAVLAQAKGN
jgi:hypothetical protein